jgi:excisionase family DNA binding protein
VSPCLAAYKRYPEIKIDCYSTKLVRLADEKLLSAQSISRQGFMTSAMKIREVATYLRVHPSTIYRLLRRGELPAFKMGSDWRFNLETIDQWRAQKQTWPINN